jgi:methylmalonyl-CoA mutase N-terminal domain/subunit
MLDGVLAGIEAGWFQKEIAESAYREQRRFESGDLVKVGVNAFPEEYESPIDTLIIGPETERAQRRAVEETRTSRDADAAASGLTALTDAARGDANLMLPLIGCARARCTEGEIVAALVEVFGDYRETPRF